MEIAEIRRRMQSGELYFCNDETLMAEQMERLDKVFAYNQLPPSRQSEKQALLKELFAAIGEDCYIETPFYANWGGKYVRFGKGVYANFGLTLVDDGVIEVGDHVMFAPHVTLATGTHPIHPELRAHQAQYNLPIRIGNNVWLGAGCCVMPGVTIGENTVVGAGSVVTRDLPANVVAAGVPCRVLRPITDGDRRQYDHGRLIDLTVE